MSPPPNELYTAFSFIGFVLCIIPMYWHFEAWNTGTCFYMAWTGLGCLIQCINSIVWNKNMVNRAPIYCDIATRIQVALNVAIPASSLCISRRLYKIATVQAVMVTRTEKRRRVIVDLFICLGIPILQMAAQYIVSGRRYDLYEDFGPLYHLVLRPPSIPLFYAWPIVIGTVSLVYSAMTIFQFVKRERQFNEIISSNPSLNRNRYIRLMILCSIEMLGTVPLAVFVLAHDLHFGFHPWVSWADVHSNYSHIHQYPNIYWKNNSEMVVGNEFFRWSLVLCAFVFFAFFGFADEARQNYRRLYRSLASRIGSSTLSGTFIGSSHAYVDQPVGFECWAHVFSVHPLYLT
ncbi:GPCR fungal pheromone mating factor [Lactifluus subvellereus]|nr:GPCR fungal pheromone mating factor [Lactifluus subvellereus]